MASLWGALLFIPPVSFSPGVELGAGILQCLGIEQGMCVHTLPSASRLHPLTLTMAFNVLGGHGLQSRDPTHCSSGGPLFLSALLGAAGALGSFVGLAGICPNLLLWGETPWPSSQGLETPHRVSVP